MMCDDRLLFEGTQVDVLMEASIVGRPRLDSASKSERRKLPSAMERLDSGEG